MHYSRLGLQTLLATSLLRAVRAGAGANVNGCLWLQDGPDEPFEVTFKAGSDQDHCMYNTGQDATFSVSHSGLTCAPLGYVEGKSSSSGGDTCWSDYSNWGLSYTGGNYSGFAFAHWTTSGFGSKGGFELQDNSQGTKVCMGQGLCSRTTQYWSSSDTPQIYVIFDAEATPEQYRCLWGYRTLGECY